MQHGSPGLPYHYQGVQEVHSCSYSTIYQFGFPTLVSTLGMAHNFPFSTLLPLSLPSLLFHFPFPTSLSFSLPYTLPLLLISLFSLILPTFTLPSLTILLFSFPLHTFPILSISFTFPPPHSTPIHFTTCPAVTIPFPAPIPTSSSFTTHSFITSNPPFNTNINPSSLSCTFLNRTRTVGYCRHPHHSRIFHPSSFHSPYSTLFLS